MCVHRTCNKIEMIITPLTLHLLCWNSRHLKIANGRTSVLVTMIRLMVTTKRKTTTTKKVSWTTDWHPQITSPRLSTFQPDLLYVFLCATYLGWEDMDEEEEEGERDEEVEEEEEDEAAEQPAAKPQRDIRHRPDATRILTTEDFQLIGDSLTHHNHILLCFSSTHERAFFTI